MVPEGWIITQLSELADIKRGAGSQYLTYVEAPDDGIRLIRISDFLGDSKKYVLHTSAIDRFILRKDDILIAGTGATAGIIFRVPDEYSGLPFSYNAPRIRPKTTSCSGYLYYFLCSDTIIRQQHALFTGNAQPFLDTRAIGGFKVLAPPVLEQKRIAQILSTWDQAITATERLLKNSQQRKKGLIQQLLTGKKRLPGFAGKFQRRKLHELAKVDAMKLNSKTPDDFEFRYISLSDVERGTISDQLGKYLYKNSPSRARRVVSEGDLLVATVRPNLQAFAKVSEKHHGYVASTGFSVVSPKAVVCGDYIYQYLYSAHITGQINSLVAGSNYPAISASDVKGLTIYCPDLEEQKEIAEILCTSDQYIILLRRKLSILKRQKKALMQQLLTGKRRVKVDSEAA